MIRNIQNEPRDLGSVVELIAKTEGGFASGQIKYNFNGTEITSGNPSMRTQTPIEMIDPLQRAWRKTATSPSLPTNEQKASVRRISWLNGDGDGEGVKIEAVRTDYFTISSLPEVAPELLARYLREMTWRREGGFYETLVPSGIVAHNVLISEEGVVLMRRSTSAGTKQGLVSATIGEQMDPAVDSNPFSAASRGFREELGLEVEEDSLRLLAIGIEKGAANPAFVFGLRTSQALPQILDSWLESAYKTEHTDMFAVPFSAIEAWLNGAGVDESVWSKHRLHGATSVGTVLKLHPLASWILGLAEKYSASFKIATVYE